MSPTPFAGWVLAATALTALILPIPLAVALFLGVAVAVAADMWSVRTAPDVTRTLPRIVSRTVPAPITIEVADRAFTTFVRQPSLPDVSIAPQESPDRLEGTVTATRRGRHTLGPVHTRTIGVLRLGQAFHVHGDEHELLVYPDMPAAYRIAAAVRTGKFSEEGSRSRGPLGLGTEFESIRDYLPDDDIRQVNWRATARIGRPMTNQYRLEQNRDIIILIDAGRLMSAPVAEARTRMDAAIDAATSVAIVADQAGDRCGVIAFDGAILHDMTPTRSGGIAVVRRIFDVEPAASESDYEQAFRRVGSAKRAFVLVLTDVLDEAAAQSLLDSVATLAKRHAVVVASISDTEVEAAVSTAPTTEQGALRTLVAIDVLKERTRVMAQLRHRGAQVLEAPYEKFSAACVASYLRAKAAARL